MKRKFKTVMVNNFTNIIKKNNHISSQIMKREKKLKSRIQELVLALENLSRNSEIRHQQSTEFVNDLKRANSALISAFKDRETRTPLKTRGELMCSGRGSSSCSTNGTRHA
jgi:hypothetical protein